MQGMWCNRTPRERRGLLALSCRARELLGVAAETRPVYMAGRRRRTGPLSPLQG